MAFRMSEQPRTIKIYNLLAGTNEFIGEGDALMNPLMIFIKINKLR